MKIGDTVRYLNAVGGGIITRIDGKIAYVEEDGFETPVLASELVVVLPAGHQPDVKGAHVIFDQKAYDAGRKPSSPDSTPSSPSHLPLVGKDDGGHDLPPSETPHGEKINLTLAFEPADIKNLSKTTFNAVLVNDSNYFLDFTFLRRSGEERAWTIVFHGTVAPNELIDLAQYSHDTLSEIERVAIQAIPYKLNKPFTLKNPVSVRKRLDLTKFFKLHCFRPGLYFDSPVLETVLLTDDLAPAEPKPAESAELLAQKFRVDAKPRKHTKNPADNPNKLLPPIEVDLHAGELLDTTAGLRSGDILQHQLDTVRRIMKEHTRRKGQKIIFIHGKGEGVLRKAVLALLRKEFPAAETQDASFREYGFGATLVTIH